MHGAVEACGQGALEMMCWRAGDWTTRPGARANVFGLFDVRRGTVAVKDPTIGFWDEKKTKGQAPGRNVRGGHFGIDRTVEKKWGCQDQRPRRNAA